MALSGSEERIFGAEEGCEVVALGLYLIKAGQVCVHARFVAWLRALHAYASPTPTPRPLTHNTQSCNL